MPPSNDDLIRSILQEVGHAQPPLRAAPLPQTGPKQTVSAAPQSGVTYNLSATTINIYLSSRDTWTFKR